jgi:hypothetical protein
MRAIRPSLLRGALRSAPVLALAVGALGADLAAQGPARGAVGATPVAVGARVRIAATPPIGSREGRLVADDGRTFVLRSAAGDRTRLDTIPAPPSSGSRSAARAARVA